MGFNVRTETERIGADIKADLKNEIEVMKNKAKKQIDELIDNLKTNEFLKRPAIQNLIEKVGQQSDLNQRFNQKVESVVGNVKNDVVARVGGPVKKAKKAVKSAETAVKKVKSTSPKQLLEMIKTSDMANRIASSILSKAENINQKWLETVNNIKPSAKKAADKSAPKKTSTKKTVKKKAPLKLSKTSAKSIKSVKQKKSK